MKRQWRIQTRLLLTLVALTAFILMAVGLAFNLSVRGYIRSRVAAQLTSVSESASSDRRGGREHGKRERPDRITGTTGNAVVLDESGALVSSLRGDAEVAEALADYYSAHGFGGNRRYQTFSIGEEQYAASVSDDPLENGCYLVSYVDVTSILALTGRINTVLLLIILAAILLSVVLSRRFARSFAAPVQELSAFARDVGSGRFAGRDLHFRDVEFGQLADSMNRMAAELREAQQKQDVFFQNVSHELRTPLTSIRGNAEGMVYGVIEPQTALNVILSESDRLSGMVEDILYLSRMGKTAPEGAVEPLDLREALDLCAGAQRTEAERRGVSFRFDFDDAPVLFPIREQDARQLFGNLISNAIRYAKREVRLVCRREAQSVIVRVADDGSGIAPDDLPRIFERFYKGAGGRHGIGLAIAQSVVRVYHGSLTARNDGGAVFEVRFLPVQNPSGSDTIFQ